MPSKDTSKNKAASELGRLSAEARRKELGEEKFIRKMRQLGKKGGRPVGAKDSKPRKRRTTKKGK
jgi:hypothetical protein